MATYVIPPGAWLSGSALHPGIGGQSPLYPGIGRAAQYPGIGRAAQYPGIGAAQYPGIAGKALLHPPIGGHSPQHPGIGGTSPLEGSADSVPAARLAAAAARLTVAAPWRGEDPPWVYDDAAPAMLAEAMDRSRSRLVRSADPRREGPDGPFVAQRPTTAGEGDTLWRWGQEPRALAVLADLGWRFAVSGACLWYLHKSDHSGRQVTFEESISFAAIPNNKAWYDQQIDKVLRAAVEREDRLPEILSQMDGFMPFFSSHVGITPITAPITFELLSIAERWAAPLVMAMKNQIAARRPNAASTRVVPAIETPPHGSLPSGHATIAALMSRLLGVLMYGKDSKYNRHGKNKKNAKDNEDDKKWSSHPKIQQLDRLARRIAFNRVVAGVHFPIDSRAGHALGLQLAAHFIGLAASRPQPKPYDMKFDIDAEPELSEEGQPRVLNLRPMGHTGVADCPLLGLFWRAACRELVELGVEGVPL